MKIRSIHIGQPATYSDGAGTWRSATAKQAIHTPVAATTKGLVGDAQADNENHGGFDKAILLYSQSHYDFWRTNLERLDFPDAALGENLCIDGGGEHDVCIGDRFQFGDVLVEVSQPRQPCWKQARRWNVIDFVARIQQSGRTGWYVRVLREGMLQPQITGRLVARPNPEWTIARANRIFHHEKDNPDLNRALHDVPELSFSWRRTLSRRYPRTG
jgi:MOSC domain-containing protein YiiM